MNVRRVQNGVVDRETRSDLKELGGYVERRRGEESRGHGLIGGEGEGLKGSGREKTGVSEMKRARKRKTT